MKTTTIALLIVLVGCNFAAMAQDGSTKKKNAKEVKQTPIAFAYPQPISCSIGECLDTIDLSGFMPPVGDQDKQYSCSAWAAGYACRSYYNTQGKPGFFYSEKADSSLIISPSFIYNSLNNQKRTAVLTLYQALRFLKDTGACSIKAMPYSLPTLTPNAEQVKEAQQFRIKTFATLRKEGRINEIKAQLRNYQPVAISTYGYMPYFDKGKSNTRKYDAYGHYVLNMDKSLKGGKGHAVVIVGFDDRIEQFKIMNSWGSGWGNNGFGWMSYEAANDAIQQAYVMQPRKATTADAGIIWGEHTEPRGMSPGRERDTTGANPDTTSLSYLFFNAVKSKANTITTSLNTFFEPEEKKDEFSVTLDTLVQTDTSMYTLRLQRKATSCDCDSYQIIVLFYWRNAKSRDSKGAPILSFDSQYSLTNGQAAIMLDKQKFESDYYSKNITISIPQEAIAIPRGLNQLVAEAVWYSDNFAVKACSTIPVDILY